MSVYVIFRVSNPEKLEAALTLHRRDSHLKVGEGQYLVSSNGTARGLSDLLGISDGSLGSAVVFKMADYFGRASTEVWDWVKSQAESSSG